MITLSLLNVYSLFLIMGFNHIEHLGEGLCVRRIISVAHHYIKENADARLILDWHHAFLDDHVKSV